MAEINHFIFMFSMVLVLFKLYRKHTVRTYAFPLSLAGGDEMISVVMPVWGLA